MPGFQTESSRAGYQFFMILITEFFSVTLGQCLAALTPSLFISSQFDPFVVITFGMFCGVTIPAPRMPKFWHAWLYQLDPFTRLIGGMVTTALHDLPVHCTSSELNAFTAPDGQTCGEYMEGFFNAGGIGYIVDNTTSNCEYCAYSVGDEYYSTLGMSFDHRWRDLGIYIAFFVSNVIILISAVCFVSFYLPLCTYTPWCEISSYEHFTDIKPIVPLLELQQAIICVVLFTCRDILGHERTEMKSLGLMGMQIETMARTPRFFLPCLAVSPEISKARRRLRYRLKQGE
jgi:hypothetical protein